MTNDSMEYPPLSEMARALRRSAFRAGNLDVARQLLADARHLERTAARGPYGGSDE